MAQAVRIVGKGGPEVLQLAEYEVPETKEHEVRVRVAAAGVNRGDVLQRRGYYPAPPGTVPDVPGLEYAGVVEALGAHASRWSVGDRVMGIVGGGAMATELCVHEDQVLRVPDGLDLEQAAAVPEAFMTAYDALFLQGAANKGDVALIHAVGSGVGTAAIQLCCAFGVRAIGTSRTANKLGGCAKLADFDPVLVPNGEFAHAVRELAPNGVNTILDTVGAAYLQQNIRCLATRGRIVVIGLMGGTRAELNLGELLPKRAQIVGSVLRSRSAAEKASLAQSFSESVLPFFDSGLLSPVVQEVMPMESVADAHRKIESNATLGKLVLRWSSSSL